MKNMRVLVISFFLILLVGVTSFLLFSHDEKYLEANSSLFAIMLEKDDGTYLESDITSFPSEGYVFDNELSYCVNGSSIEYNDIVDKARIDTSGSEKCFMYFNKELLEVYNFDYTGNYQTFIAPKTGEYRIELWGASGALSLSGGAYTKGNITLTVGETIYIYIGQGNSIVNNGTSFNGGTGDNGGYPGGGATDIRLINGAWNNVTSLRSRIMVAGGSGTGTGNNTITKGAAGGLTGYNGGGAGAAKGATQIAAGAKELTQYAASSFGIGNGGCAGGGGYYGGGGSSCISGGGGGSSYISGHTGSVAITSASSSTPKTGCTTGTTDNACSVHYSGKVFTGTSIIDGAGNGWSYVNYGAVKMPMSSGNSYQLNGGHIGNGYAKITFMDTYGKNTTYTDLTNVRYIKECMNGSSANSGNYPVEITAYSNGVNVALNKNVTSTFVENASYPFNRLVDGNTSASPYPYFGSGLQCATVDLGQTYNLDKLTSYLFYADQRVFYDRTLSIGATNVSGTASLSKVLIDNKSDLISTESGFKFAQEW